MLHFFILLFVGLFSEVATKADPECYMNPTQLGEKYGYTMEEHWPVTDDGYILLINHIVPKSKSAPTVFLQHGLLDSSATWLLNGKEGTCDTLSRYAIDLLQNLLIQDLVTNKLWIRYKF